jgi:hypothetical protein
MKHRLWKPLHCFVNLFGCSHRSSRYSA